MDKADSSAIPQNEHASSMSELPYNWIYKTCPSKARPFSNLYIQYKRTTVEFTWNKPTGIDCIKAFY